MMVVGVYVKVAEAGKFVLRKNAVSLPAKTLALLRAMDVEESVLK
jgi:hypothetical protein